MDKIAWRALRFIAIMSATVSVISFLLGIYCVYQSQWRTDRLFYLIPTIPSTIGYAYLWYMCRKIEKLRDKSDNWNDR